MFAFTLNGLFIKVREDLRQSYHWVFWGEGTRVSASPLWEGQRGSSLMPGGSQGEHVGLDCFLLEPQKPSWPGCSDCTLHPHPQLPDSSVIQTHKVLLQSSSPLKRGYRECGPSPAPGAQRAGEEAKPWFFMGSTLGSRRPSPGSE